MKERRTARIASASVAALLAIGGTTAATMLTAGAQTVDPPTTVAPDPATPVTLVATIDLPMIGVVTITLDAANEGISDVTFTPADGITSGATTIDRHHVQLDVVLADGTTQTIRLEAKIRDGQATIEIDDHDDANDRDHDSDDDHAGPPAIEDRGNSAEHRQDDQGHNGRGRGVDDGSSDDSETGIDDHGSEQSDDTHPRGPERVERERQN